MVSPSMTVAGPATSAKRRARRGSTEQQEGGD
jgi:hypothetical protein